MSPQERRGKQLFLLLAVLILLERLCSVGLALAWGLGEVKWLQSIVQPVVFALAVAFLWQGEVWLRWLVGAACVLSGVFLVVAAPPFRDFSGKTFCMQVVGFPEYYPLIIVAVLGPYYVAAGLLFLFSPSMRAFFRYQRERQSVEHEVTG